MTLVIGFGNPLRGDDGIGPVIARRLDGLGPDVRVLTPQQLLPETAVTLVEAQRVVFIDASIDAPAGTVRRDAIGPEADDVPGHALTPATLLALTQQAFGTCPEAWFVRVHAESFTIGAPLSAAVEQAIPKALAAVLPLLPGPRTSG